MLQRIVSAIILPILVAVQAIAYGAGPLEEQSTGKKILEDTSLFPAEFVRKVREFYEDRRAFISALESPELPLDARVPEMHRPKIEEIKKKYGMPDKILEDIALAPVSGATKEELMVYWYGEYGFAVPKGQVDGEVSWVKWTGK